MLPYLLVYCYILEADFIQNFQIRRKIILLWPFNRHLDIYRHSIHNIHPHVHSLYSSEFELEAASLPYLPRMTL
jgi:hypothetical protein